MTHLWWRAITENDRFRPTYRGRRPIVRHAGRAPAENPCPNLLRRNGPPDPLGNVKAAAISDKFRETTGSFRSAPLTRLSGGAPSHQPTSFVRSDNGTNPEFRFAGAPRRRGGLRSRHVSRSRSTRWVASCSTALASSAGSMTDTGAVSAISAIVIASLPRSSLRIPMTQCSA